MEIRLSNPDKFPFFYVNGTKIYLSFENPGPVEIDFNDLTEDQQKVVSSAITRNIIVSTGQQVQEKKEVVQTITSLPEKPKKTRKVKKGNPIENLKKEQEDRIRKRLNARSNTLLHSLHTWTKQELLLAVEIEEKNKNRTIVLNAIKTLLLEHNEQVVLSINSAQNPLAPTAEEYQNRQLRKGFPSQYLSNMSSVVESNIEEVLIKTV